jgi:hypothetical protein
MTHSKFILINILRKSHIKNEKPLSIQIPNLNNEPLTAGLAVIGLIPSLQQKGLGTLLKQNLKEKPKNWE